MRGLSFILKHLERPVVMDEDVLLLYTPMDVDILEHMSIVKCYFGDTNDVVLGRHAINLCSDQTLQTTFHQSFTIQQREHVLKHVLLCVGFYNTCEHCSKEEFTMVQSFFTWREHHLKTLVRCLRVLHAALFRRKEMVKVPSIEYNGNNPSYVKFIVWAKFLKSYRRQTFKVVQEFSDLDYKPKHILDPFVESCMMLFIEMEKYKLYKRVTVRAHTKHMPTSMSAQLTLFMKEVRTVRFANDDTCVKLCRPCFKEAFRFYAMNGLREKEFYLSDEQQPTIPEMIERSRV